MKANKNGNRVFDGGDAMGLTTFFYIASTVSTSVINVGGFNYNRISYQLSIADAEGINGTISWASSEPTLAVVDQNGLVTSLGSGPVTITASSEGFITRRAVQASLTLVPADLSASVSTRILLATSATITYTVYDTNYQRVDPDIYNDSYQLTVSNLPGTLTWSTSNSTVATVSSSGLASGIAAGVATITVTNGSNSKSISLAFNRTSQGTPTITSFVTGSLRKSVEDFFVARLGGAPNPTAAKPIYTTQNHAGGVYARNTACWMNGLSALTCCSPWNSTGANTRAGTLITPRHIVFATHYQINVGATVRFVTSDNVVVNRVMTGKAVAYGDLMVGVLDSDVPGTIAFAKVLPLTYPTQLPVQLGTPVIRLDQEEKALVGAFYNESPTSNYINFSNSLAYANYSEDLIGGDSGNPAFLPIGNDLAILTTWYGGGGGFGPSVHNLQSYINTIITELDVSLGYATGYSCTPVDLSSFNSYTT